MKIEVAVDLTESDDVVMLLELISRVPELNNHVRRVANRYEVSAEGDRARYLVALMIERLQGSEPFDRWAERNSGVNLRAELLRLSRLERGTGQPVPRLGR